MADENKKMNRVKPDFILTEEEQVQKEIPLDLLHIKR